MQIERPVVPKVSFHDICDSIDRNSLTNGLVAAVFAVTGPVAIILSVASSAGLEKSIINTWIFAAFGIGGLLTLALSYLYRQPLAMAWTMPGAALLVSSFSLDVFRSSGCFSCQWPLDGFIRVKWISTLVDG